MMDIKFSLLQVEQLSAPLQHSAQLYKTTIG